MSSCWVSGAAGGFATGACTPFRLPGKELHSLGDDVKFGPFLAVFFPRVELQSAFDKDRGAFAEVLAHEFGHPTKKRDIDEGCFVNPFSRCVLSPIVHSDRVLANRHSAIGSMADLDISGKVTDEYDAVVTGHGLDLLTGWSGVSGPVFPMGC